MGGGSGGSGGGVANSSSSARSPSSSSSPSRSWGLECLIRRKRVDSADSKRERSQLAKRLSVFDLVAIGVGSTIGAGVYILVGAVAREHTGPALTFSFLLAGTAAALSAFCYAELACRCPSAGSAYHYSYICIGEGVAWLIGWSLILEFTLGGAAVARGMSPNLGSFIGGEDKLPGLLARQTIFGVLVDPCAAILVFIVTGLLCTGIKESSFFQGIITTTNIGAMLFICLAGGYLGFKSGWPGYELPNGYFPFGVNGLLAGSAKLFFSFVGFDCLTSTAEEVKSPQRDLPLGIAISLAICAMLYMLVSAVVVGLIPYYALDPDTPISSAFASYGMEWAAYIITTGTVTALCASLMGSILPQPRILMAMARDGLLPSFFSDINKHTRVPVKSTIVTGLFIAILAFLMDVSQLAGMVSVGTLLAFTIVAISILVIRYIPPPRVSLPTSVEQSVDPVSFQFGHIVEEIDAEIIVRPVDDCSFLGQSFLCDRENSDKNPLLEDHNVQGASKEKRRQKIVTWSITIICIGVFVLSSAASAKGLPSVPRFMLCGVGVFLLSGSLFVLTFTDQADTRHTFGHSGGFICPFVPYLPVACILVNTYLLINLGAGTWIRVCLWLLLGVLIYVFYGRNHSLLKYVVPVPNVTAEDTR
ncbi:cationic amino acid transporter 4, vacuolar-like [Coffea eugenioides]|uniref:cationic amino acid transporter 4, vacuolar-like n=1 Tax=Coffea eugenioides TaxID=49369 RepID=UPI000F607398|nr:cationic amino acid transporter 4, vacuolar-like [Coffea eugenioides]